MDNALTTKDKWEDIWNGVKLPTVHKPVYDIQRQLETYLQHSGTHSLIEIGCAPGGWMAYFKKKFGYRVAGVEYAETAAEATRQNMRMLEIDAIVFVQDFFAFNCVQNKYDIVFSAGFIEHFRDASVVLERICALSGKYVITIVPNTFGINGFISKTIRPKVYAEHNPIDVPMLEVLHENCGLKTLFCNYVGGVRFIMPGAHNDFFKTHKLCARVVNIPVYVFNWLSEQLQKMGAYIPRNKLFSDGLLYIGVKQEN